MKPIILILLTSILTWANGSFYDLYAQNRATEKPNLITADFIASAYATYKLNREQQVEEKILKPRVINFVNYLYQGVLEMNMANKEQSVAYTGVLSLLAKNGQNLILPDEYATLAGRIRQEAELITNAKHLALSPVMQVNIDYKTFKVPTKYRDNPAYFRVMKYAQTIQFNQSLATNIHNTIQSSERLSNLNRYIKKILEQFIGVEKKSNSLLSTYKGLDYYIFQKSTNPSINNIIQALNPKTSKNPTIQQRLLNLYSSYDYDLKIMQTLLKDGHTKAFKGYYTQSQYRNMLYTTKYQNSFTTKDMHQESRTTANIELKLEETLSVMIEGASIFANTIKNNQVDKSMITALKELRKIAQKKSLKITFTPQDIRFLNSLDLIFLELSGVKDRPIKVKVTKNLTQEILTPSSVGFGDGSWGGRFVHREF